jgi:uncharacterized protein YaaR (DUF327 family)
MNNKEIVQRGLETRKALREAKAQAKRYQEAVGEAKDARFYDHLNWENARREWQAEKYSLLWEVNDLKRAVDQLADDRDRLADDRDRLIEQKREIRQQNIIVNVIKAIIFGIVLLACWNLGLVVGWLADMLLAVSVVYMGFAIVKLARLNKKEE